MSLITQIPPLNHIRFVPNGQAINPRYHFVHFDQDFFQNTIQYWQVKKPYYQKVELGDRVTVQIHTQGNSGANPPTLHLLDVNGNVVNNLSAYSQGVITWTGNTYNGTQLDTSFWTFRPTQILGSTTGFYYLLFTNTSADGSTSEQWCSEPIRILASHPKTMLVEYGNSSNKQNIIIDGWPFGIRPKFGLRVEADLRRYQPYNNAVSYKDQLFDQHNLDSEAWRTFQFKVGGRIGVPAYVIDKLTAGFSCDSIRLDNKPFIYNNDNTGSSTGAQTLWSLVDSETSPLVRGSILVRYPNTVDSFTSVSTKIQLTASAMTYPCALPYLTMNNGLTFMLTAPQVFNSSTDANNYITTLNSTIAAAYDLGGAFSLSGDIFFYTNGTGENYTCTSPTVPLTTYLSCTVDATLSISAFQYTFINGGTITDWGDGTIQYNLAAGGSITPSHTYHSSGNKTLRVFTDNIMTSLAFTTGGNAFITAIDATTKVSGALKTFNLSAQGFAGSISPAFLNNAAGTLTKVIMSNSGITAFSPQLLSTAIPKLSYIDVGHNSINSATVDAIFNNIVSGGLPGISGGQAITKFQTPTAPPTSSSASSRGTLITRSWLLSTD